jgi:hypothetical protein
MCRSLTPNTPSIEQVAFDDNLLREAQHFYGFMAMLKILSVYSHFWNRLFSHDYFIFIIVMALVRSLAVLM